MDLRLSKQTYEKADVPLFYYSVKNFSPATVLNTTNVAGFIPDNNPEHNIYERLEPTTVGEGSYTLPERFKNLPSGSLIITDRATRSRYVDYAVPLYYEYQLMYDHYSPEDTHPEGFVVVRKNNEDVVTQDMYQVENRDNTVGSGRYGTETDDAFLWSTKPISGNVITARVLLPARTNDNNFYTVEYNRYFNNSIAEYWSELIDEKPAFIENLDYNVTNASITIPYSNSRLVSGNAIYVQRNPDTYVKVKYPSANDDKWKTKQWELSVSLGQFFVSSGVISNGGLFYYCDSDVTWNSLPTAEEPAVLSVPNVVRLAHRSIIAPSSTVPRPGYVFSDVVSKLYINGIDSVDKVTSVDTKRGFLMLNKELNSSDSVVATYNHDPQSIMVVRNADLNPASSGTTTSVVDVAASGLGVAIVPSGTSFYDQNGDEGTFSNIALYNLADQTYGDFTSGVPGWGASALDLDTLGTDLVSGTIPSGSLFLGSVTVNVSPEQNVDMVDIRRHGGYDEGELVSGANINWRGYSDVGYWDGEPLPMAGTVIIQIPMEVYNNVVRVFEQDENLSVDPVQYPEDVAKVLDKSASEDYSREQLVMRAANKYIKDVVERYLPAGTHYVIVDENLDEWPSIRSEV